MRHGLPKSIFYFHHGLLHLLEVFVIAFPTVRELLLHDFSESPSILDLQRCFLHLLKDLSYDSSSLFKSLHAFQTTQLEAEEQMVGRKQKVLVLGKEPPVRRDGSCVKIVVFLQEGGQNYIEEEVSPRPQH